MKENELKIIIAGKTGTGKSSMIYFLKEFLRDNGFEVEFDGSLDHIDENNFDYYMKDNNDEKLNNIKDRIKITFIEEQLKRKLYGSTE